MDWGGGHGRCAAADEGYLNYDYTMEDNEIGYKDFEEAPKIPSNKNNKYCLTVKDRGG